MKDGFWSIDDLRKKSSPWNRAIEKAREIATSILKPPAPPVTKPQRDSGQMTIVAEAALVPTSRSAFVPAANFCAIGDIYLSKSGDVKCITFEAGNNEKAVATLRAAIESGYQVVNVQNTQSTTPPNLLPASGTSVVYVTFKPKKVVVTEIITATYKGKGLPDESVTVALDSAPDALLVGGFSGSMNAFPNAPSNETGIHAVAFRPDSTSNISWPTINPGIPVTVCYAILPSVRDRVKAPAGYDEIPSHMSVQIRTSLFGE